MSVLLLALGVGVVALAALGFPRLLGERAVRRELGAPVRSRRWHRSRPCGCRGRRR